MVTGCVRQVVVLHNNNYKYGNWEFAWADSALVILDKGSSYRGGHFDRFDCNDLS